MIRKTLFTLSLIGLFALNTKAQVADSLKTPIKSQADSACYAMGTAIAQDLKSRMVTDLNFDLFVQAMQDVFKGKNSAIDLMQGQKAIMAYFATMKAKASEPLIAEAKRFLDENKKKKGVITTVSGLQYEIVKAVKGAAQPKATDDVTVHYRGTLTNGYQFDTSYDRKEPLKITLNKVIKGWTEGVQLMTLGSTYRFYIPYQLGYGENGAGQDIPPYSVLIFDIELIKIGN